MQVKSPTKGGQKSASRAKVTADFVMTDYQSPFADLVWSDQPGSEKVAAGLHQGGVILFSWPLGRLVAGVGEILTADEQARADRFLFDRDQVAFSMARAGLRTVLGQWLEISPQSVRLASGEHGKPGLDLSQVNSPLQFNLSHSGGLALLALSLVGPLGVDIERIPTDKPPPWKVAQRCFTARERQALAQGTEQQRGQTFYRLWTRKEAVVKLLGEGLQAPLQAFNVSADNQTACETLLPLGNQLGRERCWLQSVGIAEGFVAALACCEQPERMIHRPLELRAGCKTQS